MGYGNAAARAYGNVGRVASVNSAGPIDIVVLLYDKALEHLGVAEAQMAAEDWAGKGISIGKANDILNELTAALDVEKGGEIAHNLSDLYGYMVLNLTEANLNKNALKVGEVKGLLKTLRDPWAELARKQSHGGFENVRQQQAVAA